MLGFLRLGALWPARSISMIDKQKAVFSMVPFDGTVSDNNSSWRLYNAWARVNGLGLRMHTSTWKAVIKIRLHYNATTCCMCASLHLKWAISPQTDLLLCLHLFSALFWVTCLYLCERALVCCRFNIACCPLHLTNISLSAKFRAAFKFDHVRIYLASHEVWDVHVDAQLIYHSYPLGVYRTLL